MKLDYPSYHAVVTHGDDRNLRASFYKAWATRASDEGDNEQWDNSEAIEKILALRHEAALLVGFKNYAEYSLATKMAGEVSEVLGFLTELADRTRAGAQKELDSIQEIVDTPLEAWDVAYYLEKLKQKKFSISDNELREYFPVAAVQAGLFSLAEKLYGIVVTERSGVCAWHETVCYYEVKDQKVNYSVAFMQTCTPGRASAVAPGWTNALSGKALAAMQPGQWGIWCAISRHPMARAYHC